LEGNDTKKGRRSKRGSREIRPGNAKNIFHADHYP
jgi:hypothetical protein